MAPFFNFAICFQLNGGLAGEIRGRCFRRSRRTARAAGTGHPGGQVGVATSEGGALPAMTHARAGPEGNPIQVRIRLQATTVQGNIHLKVLF